MSTSSEKTKTVEAETTTPAEGAPGQQRQQQQQLKVDDSNIKESYANFCRVTGTPEELIIDFGLNPQPFNISPDPVIVRERIVTNYFTAKRMLHALQLTLQRHESMFGVVEPDVQKRLQPGARVQPPPRT